MPAKIDYTAPFRRASVGWRAPTGVAAPSHGGCGGRGPPGALLLLKAETTKPKNITRATGSYFVFRASSASSHIEFIHSTPPVFVPRCFVVLLFAPTLNRLDRGQAVRHRLPGWLQPRVRRQGVCSRCDQQRHHRHRHGGALSVGGRVPLPQARV